MSDTECCPVTTFIDAEEEKPKTKCPKKVVIKEEPKEQEIEELEVEPEDEVDEAEEDEEDGEEDDEDADDDTYTEEELIHAAKEVGETGFKLGWVYGVRDYALGSGVIGLLVAGSLQLGLSVVKNFF